MVIFVTLGYLMPSHICQLVLASLSGYNLIYALHAFVISKLSKISCRTLYFTKSSKTEKICPSPSVTKPYKSLATLLLFHKSDKKILICACI
jgi:hypothetical protein